MKDAALTILSKPINQDISELLFENNNIYSRLNMEIITRHGSTNADTSNSLGNTLLISLPRPTQVWRFDITTSFPWVGSVNINITIVADGDPTIINVLLKTEETAYYDIVNAIRNAYPSGDINAVIKKDNTGILIYSPVCKDVSVTHTFPVVYSTTDIVIDTITEDVNIIGWVHDSEGNLYVLSTPEKGDPIENNYRSTGQIWKVSANNPVVTYKLIYHNYLNFTIKHLIKNPTQIEIAEQNNFNKSIYFTDFYNRIRRINVNDPDAFGINPDDLNLNAKITWTTPYVSEILQQGNILTGWHSFAFRYKNLSGASSNVSPESVFIPIVYNNDINSEYKDFPGNYTNYRTTKSLKVIINELDLNFDYLELIHIYTNTDSDITTIEIIDGLMPVTSKFEYIYHGDEDVIPMTLSEFRSINQIFEKVNTIESMDNLLFLGNVEIAKRELTGYETRAVRFPKNSNGETQTQTTVYNSAGDSFTVNKNLWSINSLSPFVNEEDDCIQYTDSLNNATTGTSQNPLSKENLLFYHDPNDITGATFGGEGPNIKYRFVNNFVNYDNTNVLIIADNWGTPNPWGSWPSYLPVLNVPRNNDSLKLNDDNTFPVNNNFWADYSSSFIAAHCKNWMRDEIYAFSIEFFDLYGQPYHAKWIADIRMPRTMMGSVQSGNTTLEQYFEYCSPDTYFTAVFPLGIEFTISNLDAIKDRVSGCRILCVKREDRDKTITGQGMFIPAIYNNFGGKHYLCTHDGTGTPFDDNNNNTDTFNDVGDLLLYTGCSAADVQSSAIASIQSPDYNIYKKFIKPSHIDFQFMVSETARLRAQKQGNLQDRSAIGKYYRQENDYLDVHQKGWDGLGHMFPLYDSLMVEDFVYGDDNTSFTLNNILIANRAQESSENLPFGGGRTLVLNGPFSNLVINPGSDIFQYVDRRFIANLKRGITPYKGTSYSARSLREYKPCTNFIPIRKSDTVKVIKSYGGDTYINIYVNNKFKKWWGPQPKNDSRACNVVHCFPVENTVNTAWRTDNLTNSEKTVFNDDGTGIDLFESHTCPGWSSAKLDVSVYYPKPFPYLGTEKYDKRIYVTEKKLQDELFDSWGVIKANNFLDLDVGLGQLNALARLKQRLHFIQTDGFGVLSVNDRVLLQANEVSKLVLGDGEKLARADYINTSSGTKHQTSVLIGEDSLFYFDIKNMKHMRFNSEKGLESFSDTKGLRSHFIKNLTGSIMDNDNPLIGAGMAAIFDNRNLKHIFTFIDKQYDDSIKSSTVSSSEFIDGYDTFYSFTPYMYMQNRQNYFSVIADQNNKIWIHNKGKYANYYENQYTSDIRIQINKDAYKTKQFDSVVLSTEVVDESLQNEFYTSPSLGFSFDKVRFSNSYQNTGWIDFNTISRLREKNWNAIIPRDFVIDHNLSIFEPSNLYNNNNKIGFLPQLKDRFINIDLSYNNDNNYRISFKMLQLNYRTI